jgi:hypothetical protein
LLRAKAGRLAAAIVLAASAAAGAPAPRPGAPATKKAASKHDESAPPRDDSSATPKNPSKQGEPIPPRDDSSAPEKDGDSSAPNESGDSSSNGTTPDAAPTNGDEPAKSTPVEPLADPWKYHQDPKWIAEPPPRARYWTVEVGPDTGLVKRPANGDGVHDSVGVAVGGHARVRVLPWLDARLMARVESAPFTYDDGAFGLPKGTHVEQPGPRRVYLALAAEPTWSPMPRLDLWAGVGIAWGRTTAPTLHVSGSEVAVVPTRAAVFVEVPLSLGVRYELLRNWLVVNLSATVGFPSAQSGSMLESYRTPGKNGTLISVGAFPEPSTSVMGLAGLGVLL